MLLLRLLSMLPLWLLHALGALAGALSWACSPGYRARFLANSQKAVLRPGQRFQAVLHAGRMIAELPWLWLRPHEQTLGAHLQWRGIELIDEALRAKKGLVLLTPHMGCFEVTAQAYAERFGATHPITVLFRPARQAWMREVVQASRGRTGLDTAPASLAGVRQMLRALRRGECVGLLPDQVPPEGLGVWSPFFGQPAYTMTLGARLVQQTGAPVLLIWGERLSWGRGYVVHLRPGPLLPAGASAEAAALIINEAMQSVIQLAPEQYLWGYNRYKSPSQEGLS